MALYSLFYTPYVHEPFILSSVFRRKVHSLREAILSHYNKSLWFVQALFFSWCAPKLGIEMADTSYRYSVSNTGTRTLILHGAILKRDLGNKRKRGKTLKREQTDVISSDASKGERATRFCLQEKGNTEGGTWQRVLRRIQKQLIHTHIQ